jgi:integrase
MLIRDALDAVLADYMVNDKRSTADAATKIRHLRANLDCDRELSSVTVADLLAYAQKRRAAGRSPASVNREVAFLRRAYTLAGEPWSAKGWKKLREAPPRQGFSSKEELARIVAELPAVEANIVRFLFLTGWRRQEALDLQWDQVDFDRLEVRLRAEDTKSQEPRVFPMYPQLYAVLQAQLGIANGAYVFHRSGKPVRSFYDAWCAACRRAGCAGRLLHDFRRTAARNLIEAGVDRQVAMQLLGHKTESIFNRYRITTKRELQRAVSKLSDLLA